MPFKNICIYCTAQSKFYATESLVCTSSEIITLGIIKFKRNNRRDLANVQEYWSVVASTVRGVEWREDVQSESMCMCMCVCIVCMNGATLTPYSSPPEILQKISDVINYFNARVPCSDELVRMHICIHTHTHAHADTNTHLRGGSFACLRFYLI